jgi:hypothetical protein
MENENTQTKYGGKLAPSRREAAEAVSFSIETRGRLEKRGLIQCSRHAARRNGAVKPFWDHPFDKPAHNGRRSVVPRCS